MKTKIILMSVLVLCVLVLGMMVHNYFSAVTLSDLKTLKKAHEYCEELSYAKLNGESEETQEAITTISVVLENDLVQKGHKNYLFRSIKNDDFYTVKYDEISKVTKQDRFYSQLAFLYFKLLLKDKQEDLYYVEFLKYYPKLDTYICAEHQYIDYLTDYGNLEKDELYMVFNGFEDLRSICTDEDDRLVCDMSAGGINLMLQDKEIGLLLSERTNEHKESGIFEGFTPWTWTGFTFQ